MHPLHPHTQSIVRLPALARQTLSDPPALIAAARTSSIDRRHDLPDEVPILSHCIPCLSHPPVTDAGLCVCVCDTGARACARACARRSRAYARACAPFPLSPVHQTLCPAPAECEHTGGAVSPYKSTVESCWSSMRSPNEVPEEAKEAKEPT